MRRVDRVASDRVDRVVGREERVVRGCAAIVVGDLVVDAPLGPRPRVARQDLPVLREPLLSDELKRAVAARTDVREDAIAHTWICEVVGREGIPIVRRAQHVVASRIPHHHRRVQRFRVNPVELILAFPLDVLGRQREVGEELVLDPHHVLIHVRLRDGRIHQQVVRGRQACELRVGVGPIHARRNLHGLSRGVGELILGRPEGLVITAVMGAHDGLVIFRHIPGDAEARVDRRRAEDVARGRRPAAIERDPHAGLQPDAIGHSPPVLRVECRASARC